ncbi:MAG: hypothetical protein WCL70_13685 [Paludibacter sp.]
MEIYDIKWFDTEESRNDLEMIRGFVSRIPQNFNIIMESGFYNLIAEKQIMGIDYETFQSAFREMEISIDKFLNRFERYYYRSSYFNRLVDVGLVNSNLHLKANLLNHLWGKVINKIREIGANFINLWDIKVFWELHDFLKDLIVILGSLVSAFPILEIVKEFIELIDNLSSTCDDLRLCPVGVGI